jgi:endonuclease-8
MPEGDTIARAARSLSRALVGGTLTAVRSPLGAISHGHLVGRSVVGIDTYGKNLVMRFDDGRALHTHMQMSGSWHIYRPGERWRQSPGAARVVLEVEHVREGKPPVPFVVVCFRAPVVRLLDRVQSTRDPRLLALGPDILAPALDEAEILRRMRTENERALGDVVLDQHVVAGIGNIYKSETLFLVREDPFQPVAEVDDARLRILLARARELMQANTSPIPPLANRGSTRVTRFSLGGPRYWVYKRGGEPCLVCGAKLAMRRQGEALRSTYYCPSCQPQRQQQEAT